MLKGPSFGLFCDPRASYSYPLPASVDVLLTLMQSAVQHAQPRKPLMYTSLMLSHMIAAAMQGLILSYLLWLLTLPGSEPMVD